MVLFKQLAWMGLESPCVTLVCLFLDAEVDEKGVLFCVWYPWVWLMETTLARLGPFSY